MNKLTHKHHILPKHAGGTDDVSNLIELTIEEHAEAHRILFEKYGRIGDFYAWKGLSGCIGKDEILRGLAMAQKGKCKPEGFGKKISAFRKTFRYSEESKKKISDSKKGKKISEEHKNKISKSLLGHKSSEYQKKRTSETKQKTYMITKPNGEQFQITNLLKFVRENPEYGLDQGNLSRGSHKGWKAKLLL